MKDLKNTFKRAARCHTWRMWWRALGPSYLLLALVCALTAWALLEVSTDYLLPLWIYGHGTGQWSAVFSALPLPLLPLGGFVAGLVVSLVLSWRTHGLMKGRVEQCSRQLLTSNRRGLYMVEVTMVVVAVLAVLTLPAVVLWLSALAAARSAMLGDSVATPLWVDCTFVLSVFASVLAAELLLTLFRLGPRCES